MKSVLKSVTEGGTRACRSVVVRSKVAPGQGLVVIDCRTTSGTHVCEVLRSSRAFEIAAMPSLRSPFSSLYDEAFVDISLAVKKETYESVLLRSKRDAAGGNAFGLPSTRFRILAFRISKIDGRPRRDLQATPSRSPLGAKRRVENVCRHSTRYDFLSPESHIMRSKFR